MIARSQKINSGQRKESSMVHRKVPNPDNPQGSGEGLSIKEVFGEPVRVR
jgi:hypothetical protein